MKQSIRISIFIILSYLTIPVNSIYSQTQFWRQTNGPYGGYIYDIAKDSVGNLYVATDGGGVFYSSSNWKHNVPDSGYYTIQVSRNDTMVGFNFGAYYLWNSINGFIFNDLNENGIFEDGDPGLSNWKLYLKHPLGIDSTTTDLSGYYVFYPITIGKCTVRVSPHKGWEQIYPKLAKPYTFTFYDYDQSISIDFSIHKIPRRTKLTIIYNDNRGAPTIQIWCGTNPNAGAGIWGVSGDYTNADYAEGEFEIPPPLPGGFDIRFVGPPNMSSNFGCGSWTDMRPYISSAQIDTYYIRFSPESANNGDYPLTFRWSKELIQQSYNGSVMLIDSTGLTTDMRAKDSLIIFNKGIDALLLIAQYPKLPQEGIYPDERSILENYHLEQNYPNPFNPTTTIAYQLPKRGHVIVNVYDVMGREVAILVDGIEEPGYKSVNFDAKGLASGVYYYRLKTDSFSETKKLILIR